MTSKTETSKCTCKHSDWQHAREGDPRLGELDYEGRPWLVGQCYVRGCTCQQFDGDLPATTPEVARKTCDCGHPVSEHDPDFGTCGQYPQCDCETCSVGPDDRASERSEYRSPSDGPSKVEAVPTTGVQKFVLGYINPDALTLFASESEADAQAQEWVTVEAASLDQAKVKYEAVFKDWQRRNETLDYAPEVAETPQHTPTPWKVEAWEVKESVGFYVAVENGVNMAQGKSRHVIQQIVSEHNAHDKLTDALRAVKNSDTVKQARIIARAALRDAEKGEK